MKNLIVRFYIEVATISAIRDTYPVATTTTAEDTVIITDLTICLLLVKGKAIKPYPYWFY
mgnify:CR=1 FL=1